MLRLRTLGGVWVEDSDGSRIPNPRPRRLALLVILAAAGPRGVSRARLRAIFWPDADEDRSRHALSQTIYALRRDLDRTLIQADADLRLDSDSITCDVQQFREALARRDPSAAYDLYQGPFAAGFSLDDSPEFDRWLEEERTALSREAESAFQALAKAAVASGDHRHAAAVWQRLTDLDPVNGRFAASYMSALAALGDRAGAVAHAKNHAAYLRRELDAEPDPAVVRLAEQLRSERDPAPVTIPEPARPAPPPAPVATGPAIEPVPRPDGRPRRQLTRIAALVAVIGALAGSILVARSLKKADPPVLAVGQIRDLTAPDSTRLGGVLSEVLATSLARLVEVEVIANSRIIELLGPAGDTVRASRLDAARRAGATEVIEGELVPAGGGQIRLALRRVAIDRGSVRGGYSVSGTDRLALLDSVTSLIATDLRIGPPLRSLAEFTPRSPIALRLYEEGLRAFYRSEHSASLQLFQEALREDSTFALAALYAYHASRAIESPDPELEALALRLAARAPERDRLLVMTSILQEQNEPAAVAYADTLATRFPHDPEALLRAATALTHHSPIGARERDLLEQAIAIDSAAPLDPRAPCRLCASLSALMTALKWADSGDAAERALERYVALRPTDATPMRELAMQQFYFGRYEAGAALVTRLANLRPEPSLPSISALFLGRLLTGRLDEADEECMVQLRHEDARQIEHYRWLCALLWRYQGRYQDASALILSDRLPGGGFLSGRHQRDPLSEAVLDLDLDRPALALREFEALTPKPGALPPGRFARELTWSLTRRGTAAVMAGEYDLARRLADSAELIGRRSLYGRDPLLHYFLRGLLSAASGDHQSAVDQFRRSIFSWNFGYTRANLELARSLLTLGRAAEAVPVLQSSLRGGWDGSNLYVSRTELHELLAQAFVASGKRDSAAAHYRIVERSWHRADQRFAERYDAARTWLTAYQGTRR